MSAAARAQELPSPASGKIWHRRLARAALPQQHRPPPGTAAATSRHSKTLLRNKGSFSRTRRAGPLHNKTWLRNNMRFSRIKRRARLHRKAGLRKP